jgi:hypothetical protein
MLPLALWAALASAEPSPTLECGRPGETVRVMVAAPARYTFARTSRECWIADQTASPARPLRIYARVEAADAPVLSAERAVLWAIESGLFHSAEARLPDRAPESTAESLETYILRGPASDQNGPREAWVARKRVGRHSVTLAVHYDAHHRHRYPERAQAYLESAQLEPPPSDEALVAGD